MLLRSSNEVIKSFKRCGTCSSEDDRLHCKSVQVVVSVAASVAGETAKLYNQGVMRLLMISSRGTNLTWKEEETSRR